MAAFRKLYDTHAGELNKYIFLFTGSHSDAEEILQDVFLKIWHKRETLPELRSFRGYLYTITRNHVLNFLRDAKVQGIWESLPAEDPVHPQQDPAQRVIYKEYYRIAQDAIARLPERRKQVFRLREEEGLSLDEIAHMLGISKSAVKQHLYAATAFIREYLRQYGVSTVYLPVFYTLIFS